MLLPKEVKIIQTIKVTFINEYEVYDEQATKFERYLDRHTNDYAKHVITDVFEGGFELSVYLKTPDIEPTDYTLKIVNNVKVVDDNYLRQLKEEIVRFMHVDVSSIAITEKIDIFIPSGSID